MDSFGARPAMDGDSGLDWGCSVLWSAPGTPRPLSSLTSPVTPRSAKRTAIAPKRKDNRGAPNAEYADPIGV